MTSTLKRLTLTALRATPQGRRVISRIEALKAERASLVAREGDVNMRLAQCQELLNRCGEIPWIPNGHFYSPIQSRSELERDFARIYAPPPRKLPDIDLKESEQLALLQQLLPFSPSFHSTPRLRRAGVMAATTTHTTMAMQFSSTPCSGTPGRADS